MTGGHIKRGNLDREIDTHRGKTICRDTGRRCPSTSQGERPGTYLFSTALRRKQLCGYLDLRLLAVEL